MIKDHPVVLERLINYYKAWYDVTLGDLGSGLPLKAQCIHRNRKEKYVLSRKAKLWAVEVNDYLYLFDTPKLDKEQAEACISFSIEDALPRVQPHGEHMYSFITAVFITDGAEPDAIKFVRRRRFTKSYKMGMHGSSPLKTALFNIEMEKVITNNMGRDLRKQIANICKE